jgi:hypothetical protein
MFRVGYAMLQFSFIGEHKQAFTVQIKAPGGIDAANIDEFGQGRAGFAIITPKRKLAQNTQGFIERE